MQVLLHNFNKIYLTYFNILYNVSYYKNSVYLSIYSI